MEWEVEVMEQEVEVMELAVMYCCPSKRKAFVAFAVGEDSLSHCHHCEHWQLSARSLDRWCRIVFAAAVFAAVVFAVT